MMRKKILSITGTRPQLIKQAALMRAVPAHYELVMVYTGQHYDASLYDQIARDLTLLHDHSLNTAGQYGDYRLAYMISAILRKIEAHQPSAIVVFGDTDSTLAGAIAANRKHLPLIHIEAGERSGNFAMPEEWNRCITDQLSDILCCASEDARIHLEKEGVTRHVVYTGDLMKDLLLHQYALATQAPVAYPYHLLTLHRNYTQQNKDSLLRLFQTLNHLDMPVVFPLHPSTEKHLQLHHIHTSAYPNIQFIPPLSYSVCIQYAKFANTILTDSGGLQKEAYWMKKKCITIRKETEWKETLEGNWNMLWYDFNTAPPIHILPDEHAYNKALYGDGSAGKKIFSALDTFLP